ncbi:MAG TPA: HAMP domain-containing sensor histidine kinase [Candidatus Dormibacteraeota bacterium]
MSLLLGGALTWVLVRDLEFQSVQDQLDRGVLTAVVQVKHQECFARPAVVSNVGAATCRLDTSLDFQDRLNSLVIPTLGGIRLLLLDSQRGVLFDSGGSNTFGTLIPVTASKRVANVGEARTTLGGQPYFAAAVKIAPARDPLAATYVVLAQPQALVATAAAGDLETRLLEAGGAALVVAMLLILLVSRSLTQPLTKLAAAAEDIAAGNYSRRVGIRGYDEIGMLGAAFDRMAEAVERARKTQRDFLANVSHELKTPLTSLIGFSQALVDGSLWSENERARAATIIHEESERVLRMAQELLDLARVEAGSISMHITAVDLGGQLQQELEMVRPRANRRLLELNLTMPSNIPPVAADPERLHQILDNLLDNAVKYAPEGTAIAISAVSNISGVEAVVANATSTRKPDPERMFERFYRADPSRSAAAGGVGLGLSISRELASAMRGRLWADFDESGNLRLHLLLPAARRPDDARIEPPAPPVEALSKSS